MMARRFLLSLTGVAMMAIFAWVAICALTGFVVIVNGPLHDCPTPKASASRAEVVA
ncbi:MAG: hypothetical protein ABW169_06355 [Sphingobium sp.]